MEDNNKDSLSKENLDVNEQCISMEIEDIIDLNLKKEDLDNREKKLFFLDQCLKKREKRIEEEETILKEEQSKLDKEKKELRLERQNLQKECEDDAQHIVEDLKNRNRQLVEERNALSKTKLNNEILNLELENKNNLINTLNAELYEYKCKLKKIEDYVDMEKAEYMKERSEKADALENENRKIKKAYDDLMAENIKLKSQLGEINNLKTSNEILVNRLNRSDSYIKYLKKLEESKGTGDDTSQIIFNEIIEKQENEDKNTQGMGYFGDEQFVSGFIEFCKKIGYVYDPKVVRSFLCSLRSSKLTILKGYSGTGKSSLPMLFSKYLRCECVVIPIQPNWRTKQDIIGFYNYFTNRFIPTELTQTLLRANVSKDRIFIVVLDEMNLARVEYYFSEFNSKLWMDSDERKIELFDGVTEYNGKVSEYIKDNKISIPDNIYFVGTINEDDSVSPISDKIFDRAQVVEFMDLPSSKSVGNLELANENIDFTKYTKYSIFNKDQKDIRVDMSIIDEVNKLVKEYFNKVIGFRSLKQVEQFIKSYVISGGKEIDAVDMQLVSKFIPKLKFLYSNEDIDNLEILNEQIKDLFRSKYKCKEDYISKLIIVNQLEGIIKELGQ